MKSIFRLLLCLLTLPAWAQTTSVKFDRKVLKHDAVQEGAQLSFDYSVINTGDVPLVLERFEVACTCTKVTLPAPVLPGETAVIHVTFDTHGKIGWQYRKVKLYGNTKRPPEEVEFRVKVEEKD